MKKLQLDFLFIIFTFLLTNTLLGQTCDPAACAAKKAKNSYTERSMSTSETQTPKAQLVGHKIDGAKSATFTFPKGKVIEVALFSIKKGQEMVVGGEYFPKVFPIAQEYGLSTSQTFTVVENTYGDAPVQQLGFFVWDSYEQKAAFDQDPRYLELRNIRNKAFEFLYMGYFQVDEAVTYTFDDQSTYDFAALWIDSMNAPKLGQYFEKVAPVAMGMEYGYQPIAKLNPLSDCTKGKYSPSVISFAKWGAADSYSRLKRNKTYKKYVHLRDEATPYKDVLVLKANIQ